MGILSAMAAVVCSVAGILGDEFLFDLANAWSSLPALIFSNMLPIALFSGVAIVFMVFLKRRYSADRNEMVQTVYLFVMTGYVVLTITCLWFRGVNMALTWPLW